VSALARTGSWWDLPRSSSMNGSVAYLWAGVRAVDQHTHPGSALLIGPPKCRNMP